MHVLEWKMSAPDGQIVSGGSTVPLSEFLVDAWIKHLSEKPVQGCNIVHRKVDLGISAEDYQEILRVCDGVEKSELSVLQVFQQYWEITACEEYATKLSWAVKKALKS
jgi:cytidine deaminase